MAGSCKPSQAGPEMTKYTRVAGVSNNGNGSGLVNGTAPSGAWNGNGVCYWHASQTYVTFKFDEPCYIWRTGSSDWQSYTAPLTVTNLDTGKNVTSTVTLKTAAAINNTVWERIYKIAEPGTYKFAYSTGLRLDGEWYFEKGGNIELLDKNKKILGYYFNEFNISVLNDFNLYTNGKALVGWYRSDDPTQTVITEDLTYTSTTPIQLIPKFVDVSSIEGGSSYPNQLMASVIINRK